MKLVAQGIELTYPSGSQALRGVDLSVAGGEFVALIGPNGAGKSSLLRVVAGLLSATRGTVLLDNRAVSTLSHLERARSIALVPQNLDFMPGFKVADFVLMGRYAHLKGWRLFSARDREIARTSLERVDATAFLDRAMHEMSGGERQRALLARAIAQEAPVVLLDEPTSALDLKHQLLVYRLIYGMHKTDGKTVVVVTHDLNLASQFADRLVLMDTGRIVAAGTAAEVLRPEVLRRVYDTDLAYGLFAETITAGPRPWVLPWAR